MFSLKMISFCKNAKCPSSEVLLEFQSGSILGTEKAKILRHLADCEFCASEIDFYAHHPQTDEPIATVEIPLPLYELAEALLGNKNNDFSSLNSLLKESVPS